MEEYGHKRHDLGLFMGVQYNDKVNPYTLFANPVKEEKQHLMG
jgi:hypothetical protein